MKEGVLERKVQTRGAICGHVGLSVSSSGMGEVWGGVEVSDAVQPSNKPPGWSRPDVLRLRMREV